MTKAAVGVATGTAVVGKGAMVGLENCGGGGGVTHPSGKSIYSPRPQKLKPFATGQLRKKDILKV